MEGDKDDSFSFCQVSPVADQNGLDEQKVVPGMRNISIKEESSIGNTVEISSAWNGATTVKEGKVGSLSFNVISTDPQRQPSVVQRQGVQDGAKNVAKNPAEKKPVAKSSRAKVPFEKGYSPMDWMKLTRTHPDLAGLKGQSNKRLITMSEVKQHQTEGSMWTVLKGRVYNIYPYMKFHPGGVDMLMKGVGKDCTSLFNKYHAWVNAEFLLEKCLVGILDDNRDSK